MPRKDIPLPAAHKTRGRKRLSTSSESRGNSTIIIGVGLLRAVAEFNEPVSLTRVSRRLQMSPSRAYRYLRALCESGLLEQQEPSGLYDLGPEVMTLGMKAMGRLDPVKVALSALPNLTNTTGLVSVITVWGSYGPTAIRCEYGDIASPIRIREGVAASLVQTAAGKLFLSYLPAQQTRDVLARELRERKKSTPRSSDVPTKTSIAAMQSDVRRAGMAQSLGTQHPNYSSIAAPVFDQAGRLQFTISLIGVRDSFDSSLHGMPAKHLRSAAAAISGRLGVTPNAELGA
jgi:DNA-binding IclR family transcriptional regulator